MKQKASPIFLYKENPTQPDSRTLLTSRSKSRLRDTLQSQDNKNNHTANKINNKKQDIFTHSRTFTMTDQEQRIKRNYSPLYQRSTQECVLFEKGVKKSEKNLNFESRIDLSFKPQYSKSPLNNKFENEDTSPRTIRRRDPNKQEENLLELGFKPLLETSRSINKKRDPNVESGVKEHSNIKERSKLKKDPNSESSETADYVVKALTTHTANKVKEVHLKFYKKENILSKENQIINNNNCENPNKINCEEVVKEHKRHFSHLNLKATKNNIEFKENGISLKEHPEEKEHNKHTNKLFNHDFYKKESRLPNKENIQTNREKVNQHEYGTIKTSRPDYGYKNIIKTEYQSGNDSKNSNNRMAQLRKKFL